jgi:cytoskeletal protein CcmA (bactofilin family)
VFKRRKPDDPLAAKPDNMLPPRRSMPDQEDIPPRPSVPTGPTDNGLGVPPFRPVQPQELQTMSRAPFTTAPAPVPALAPAPQAVPASGVRPILSPVRTPVRDPSERRTLVVGRGISLQGTVQDAERLVVEGTVEATMIRATELAISPGGVFKGEIEVEDAEIAGTIDGTLTARRSLVIRATGKVLDTARCRRLQVEDGGQITGRMEMLTEQTRSEPAARAMSEPAIP